jgi:hypothetical protein
LVVVSGTNQYKTKPLAFVRTLVPLTVAVDSAELDPPAVAEAAGLPVAAAEVPWAAGVLVAAVLELLELPHAATASAIAARPTAAYMVFMLEFLPFMMKRLSR